MMTHALILALATISFPVEPVDVTHIAGVYHADNIWSDMLMHPLAEDCREVTFSPMSIDADNRPTVAHSRLHRSAHAPNWKGRRAKMVPRR